MKTIIDAIEIALFPTVKYQEFEFAELVKKEKPFQDYEVSITSSVFELNGLIDNDSPLEVNVATLTNKSEQITLTKSGRINFRLGDLEIDSKDAKELDRQVKKLKNFVDLQLFESTKFKRVGFITQVIALTDPNKKFKSILSSIVDDDLEVKDGTSMNVVLGGAYNELPANLQIRLAAVKNNESGKKAILCLTDFNTDSDINADMSTNDVKGFVDTSFTAKDYEKFI
jgi:hypothetical protein